MVVVIATAHLTVGVEWSSLVATTSAEFMGFGAVTDVSGNMVMTSDYFDNAFELSVMIPVHPRELRTYAWVTVSAEALCLTLPPPPQGTPNQGMAGIDLRDPQRTSAIFPDGYFELATPVKVPSISLQRYGP